MLNMWYVSLLQSLGGRIAHHSQFFCQSAWKKQVLCFPHEREKWVTRSLENYCKVFCYCTVLDVTVSQEIPPIWLSGISNKSFAYVVSPLLGWFESSWSSKLNSLSFSGPPVFFFLQQCLTAPSVTLTVSPCAALFSHYLHALMVCNLSRRPICLLAHSTDTASLVSPHLAFLPQNVIDSPLAPPPPPHCLHRWISLGMKNQSRQSSALSINWVVQSASWIHTHIHI